MACSPQAYTLGHTARGPMRYAGPVTSKGPTRAIVRPAILCAVLVAAAGRDAGAQNRETAADALFDQGRSDMAAGELDTACRKFAESIRLDPQVGARMNLALCEEKRGRVATALGMYRAIAEGVPASDDRKIKASRRAAALAPRVPRIVLELAKDAPEDTIVLWNDGELGERAFGSPLPTDPGTFTIVVRAKGHEDVTMTVESVESETRTVTIRPGPLVTPRGPQPAIAPSPVTPPTMSPPKSAPVTARPSVKDEGEHLRTAGWVTGGVGAAAVVVGVVTGVLGLGAKSTGEANCNVARGVCEAEGVSANDRARTLLTGTTIAWISGAALLATGTTLLVVGHSKRADGSHASQVAVSPGGAPGAFAFSVHTTF